MSRIRRWHVMLVTVLCFGSTVLLSLWWDHNMRSALGGEELMYFPHGRFVKEAALGHRETMADIAWLRAIQYYGHHRLTDQQYQMIGHLMDVTTELDPRFESPYVFGALVMAQDLGDLEGALRLLDKGIRENPNSWRLHFEKGFILFVCSREYEQSAQYFRLAASMPECPPFALHFAAYATAKSGYVETALRLWQKVAETTDNKYVYELALKNIQRLAKQLNTETEESAHVGSL